MLVNTATKFANLSNSGDPSIDIQVLGEVVYNSKLRTDYRACLPSWALNYAAPVQLLWFPMVESETSKAAHIIAERMHHHPEWDFLVRDPRTSNGEQNRARIESLNEKLIDRMRSWRLKIDVRFDWSKFSEELLMLKIARLTI